MATASVVGRPPGSKTRAVRVAVSAEGTSVEDRRPPVDIGVAVGVERSVEEPFGGGGQKAGGVGEGVVRVGLEGLLGCRG